MDERTLKIWSLHEDRHANLMSKSVETAFLSIVDFIQDQIEHKGVCEGFFLQVEGAFSRSSRQPFR